MSKHRWTWSRALYTLVVYCLLPLIPLRLWWRSRREPAYRNHWRERFGLYSTHFPKNHRQRIWIHAVSVGETRVAATLIQSLRQEFADLEIVLTHMTPTGRATAQQLFPEILQVDLEKSVVQTYLPYDFPGAVGRFFKHYQPDMGVLLETELWPNLCAIAAQQKIPLALINARLSEHSAGKYARIRPLIQETLSLLSIGAQTADDAARLQALGAQKIMVTGNIKFDQQPSPGYERLAQQIRSGLGESKIWLWASTREGEEQLLLRHWQKYRSLDIKLIMVPRHSARFGEVTDLLRQQGYRLRRRSDLVQGQGPDWQGIDVLVGDSMGELYSYYAAADLALIGGSILPYGAQNLIEACAVGTPVILGPSTFNFTQAAQMAIEEGAAVQVQEVSGLLQVAVRLLQDEARLSVMSEAGTRFVQQHRGATKRSVGFLQGLL